MKRIPKHVAIIPDGNRRWAVNKSLKKGDGYEYGILPGVEALKKLIEYGVEEVTFYGFTKDNVKRPKEQRDKYIEACVKSVEETTKLDTSILVVGDSKSKVFPEQLKKYVGKRVLCNRGGIKVNFLINYGWDWDIKNYPRMESEGISRIDLIMRWGGRQRLSGLLPIQSVYSDFYVINNFWPAYEDGDIKKGLEYYEECDVTLGG